MESLLLSPDKGPDMPLQDPQKFPNVGVCSLLKNVVVRPDDLQNLFQNTVFVSISNL